MAQSPCLIAQGPRIATRPFWFALSLDGKHEEIAVTLAPTREIEGRVTYADIGKAVPHARLKVEASEGEFNNSDSLPAEADADGRFRVNPSSGDFFRITAFAPTGVPYLNRKGELDGTKHAPDPAAPPRLDIALPRGVLVHGKVTERGTDRPVVGGSVVYESKARFEDPSIVAGWAANETTGADGHYSIAVPPGKGYLFIYGLDFASSDVHQTASS